MSTVTRTRGTVRFAPKLSQPEMKKYPKQESLINLHCSLGRELRFKYSTGYYCTYENWDFTRQKIRNLSGILNRGLVNNYLSDLQTQLEKGISNLDANQELITKEKLKRILDDFTNRNFEKEKEEEVITLFSYIESFLELKKRSVKSVTLRSYKQTENLLVSFGKNKYRINFDNIDLTFYYNFLEYLEDEEFSLNTIGKHIKNLKSFLNSATQSGINSNLAYTNSEFKAPKELTTQIYLTDEEIETLIKLDLRDNKRLELCRDTFVVGCLIGQRVSDYNGISPDAMMIEDGVHFFKITQKKTGKEVHSVITKEIKKILKRYDNKPPPKITEQYLNEDIKDVCRIAKINQKIKVSKTRGGKIEERIVEKYNLVASHTARRSFCTNLYKKGMPIYDIMHFSGHSAEKEFYKYIRIEKEQKAVKLAKGGYFDI